MEGPVVEEIYVGENEVRLVGRDGIPRAGEARDVCYRTWLEVQGSE